MSSATVDLRSDTITRPVTAMRRAMAEAEVGDDCYGEDPTVNRLQDRVAALLGKEAALFVPTGSMANQIALRLHTQHGDDVACGEGAHSFFLESGAPGAISGVSATTVGKGGLFTAAELDAAIRPDDHHGPPTRLVLVENTHNRAGGRIWPMAELRAVEGVARRHGIPLHLDGARLLNAQVATGVPAAEIAAPFDSVSLCLSKGLGCPVGSLLAGSKALMWRAHRLRKMLGGGMRQAGILAAAGLWALDHHVERLAEDHANARVLTDRLAELPSVILDPRPPETNMVIFELAPDAPTAAAVVGRLRECGVLMNAVALRRVRAVTHLDAARADCERAATALRDVLRAAAA